MPDVSWIGEDRAFARACLDAWQQQTGYAAPASGLVFVEPEKSLAGSAWCAVGLTYDSVEPGYASRAEPPARKLSMFFLLYVQMGEPIPLDWERDLMEALEPLVSDTYVMVQPVPIPPAVQALETTWQVVGLMVRWVVG